MFIGSPSKAQLREKQSQVEADLALQRARRFSFDPQTYRIWAIVIATLLCIAFTFVGLACLMAKINPMVRGTMTVSGK